jgi:uncharacterized membrane protein
MVISGKKTESAHSQRVLSTGRVLMCAASGLTTGVIVALLWALELLPLVTWTVAATMALVWVWRESWSQDATGTERLAEEESRARSTDVAVVLAAVASLVAVGVAMERSSGQKDAVAITSVVLGLLGAVLSWALVNVVFALKYARLYYLDEPDMSGIDFHQKEPPRYSDFAYMAFTMGMAFAVPETQPTNAHVRKVALGHTLLAYLFGTGVLTVAIDLVTSLGQS